MARYKTTKTPKVKKTNQVQKRNQRTGDVKASVFTKDTQFGAPNYTQAQNPTLKTYGDFKAYLGMSGSLTRLTDGNSYLVAGSGVLISSTSNGQITITANTPLSANAITFGSGFSPYNTSYDGTSTKSLQVAVTTGKGLGLATTGLSIHPGNLTSTTSATNSWEVIVANGNSVYRETIGNVLSLGISSNVTLTNAITVGSGLSPNGSTYNNTSPITIAVQVASNSGVASAAAGIKIDPSTLTIATVASGDKVLIGDVDDSDKAKYVTAQSIADLASVGTLTNSITVGTGLSPYGDTFDGSVAKTFGVLVANSTITIASSGIAVAKVPNALSNGSGISTFTFDGSSTATMNVEVKSDGGLSLDASGVKLQISNLPALAASTSDSLAFYDQSTSQCATVTIQSFKEDFIDPPIANLLVSDNSWTGKNTFSDISGSITNLPNGTSFLREGNNISISTGSDGSVTIAGTAGAGTGDSSAEYLVLTATGSLSAERVFTAGIGISTTDAGAGGSYTIGIDDRVIATLSGSQFSGNVGVTGSIGSTVSLTSPSISGSLTQLDDGTSYLIAGNNISIASGSNGAVTISGASSMSVSSGSSTISDVSSMNFGNLASITDLGGGSIVLSGTIGSSEDGTYTDGLFTDFTSTTLVGTAVDRFNEVLKGLAPSAAPALNDIDCADSGASAKLSFGSSQSISEYANAQPSTLTPTNNLSNVDINGTYNSETASNDIRIACFENAAGTIINGTLNADVAADSPNYAADSFGNGDQGTLKLFVNDNSTLIHSVDLSSFGSGNSLNAEGSGFNLSAKTAGHFADGTNFETFQHRQGTYLVHSASQRDGWNYARVVHTIGSSDTTCNYIEWINDGVGADIPMGSSGDSLSSLSMTGLKNLSGVKYNTGGTAQYSITITNAYRNVYSTSQITFGGSNTSVSSENIPPIDYGSGEDETKSIVLSGLTATISADPILNGSISVNTNVPHPLKSNLSGVGSQSISGILLYNLSDNSTTTSETFRGESYRIVSGSYDAQADVISGGNTWLSTTSLASVDGMMFYNTALRSPNQGANSSNFSGITNGPASNVDYSSITSGLRTFYRYFQNNSGGSKQDLVSQLMAQEQ